MLQNNKNKNHHYSHRIRPKMFRTCTDGGTVQANKRTNCTFLPQRENGVRNTRKQIVEDREVKWKGKSPTYNPLKTQNCEPVKAIKKNNNNKNSP